MKRFFQTIIPLNRKTLVQNFFLNIFVQSCCAKHQPLIPTLCWFGAASLQTLLMEHHWS